MNRTGWAAARLAGGAAILAVLVWRLGTGPILAGLASVNGWSLVAAVAIGVLTTVCSAWRWRLVAAGLGVGVPLRTAVAAYYRSQLLNTALPGGVLGDVHRAVRHGRQSGNLSRSLRAVAWERAAGQLVQAVLALLVLLALPSPVRLAMPVVVSVVLLAGLGAVLLVRTLPRQGPSRRARTLRAIRADLREGLLASRAWPGITAAAALAVTGHAATFLLAARTAGSTAPIGQLLPLAMLVLLAMAVPINIGGWGPREGTAAWLFGAAGLGVGQGVTIATVYGVLVLVASLPGLAVLAATWLRRVGRSPTPAGQRLPTGGVPSDDRSGAPSNPDVAARLSEGVAGG
ncbi:MAG: YbhN family protein [Jatrophihabitantaceae bacterium]